MTEATERRWALLMAADVDQTSVPDESGFRELAEGARAHVPVDRIVVACSRWRVTELARGLPDIPEQNFVVAPSTGGSAPLAVLATALIWHIDPDARVVLIPELLPDGNWPDWLELAFTIGIEAAEISTFVAVGAMRPDDVKDRRPYGKLVRGSEPIEASHPSVFAIEAQTEDAEPERTLLNTGIVAWQGATLLRRVGKQRPDLAVVMRATGNEWRRYDYERVMAMQWSQLSGEGETVWTVLRQPGIGRGAVIASM